MEPIHDYLAKNPDLRKKIRAINQEQLREARARDAAEARAKKSAQPAAAREEPGAYGVKG